MRQVIIIGSGPAGYTAGIYAARAGLRPLIVASSVEAGGEVVKTVIGAKPKPALEADLAEFIA